MDAADEDVAVAVKWPPGLGPLDDDTEPRRLELDEEEAAPAEDSLAEDAEEDSFEDDLGW